MPRCAKYFSKSSGAHRHLHSFPTRRSSDLAAGAVGAHLAGEHIGLGRAARLYIDAGADLREVKRPARSEEHTSELQSHVNLVCRLLLEKKKLVNRPSAKSSETFSEGEHRCV